MLYVEFDEIYVELLVIWFDEKVKYVFWAIGCHPELFKPFGIKNYKKDTQLVNFSCSPLWH